MAGVGRTCSEAACSYTGSNASRNQSLNTIKIFLVGFQMLTLLSKCCAAPVVFVRVKQDLIEFREPDQELQ